MRELNHNLHNLAYNGIVAQLNLKGTDHMREQLNQDIYKRDIFFDVMKGLMTTEQQELYIKGSEELMMDLMAMDYERGYFG